MFTLPHADDPDVAAARAWHGYHAIDLWNADAHILMVLTNTLRGYADMSNTSPMSSYSPNAWKAKILYICDCLDAAIFLDHDEEASGRPLVEPRERDLIRSHALAAIRDDLTSILFALWD